MGSQIHVRSQRKSDTFVRNMTGGYFESRLKGELILESYYRPRLE
jgi:hypothetical protein